MPGEIDLSPIRHPIALHVRRAVTNSFRRQLEISMENSRTEDTEVRRLFWVPCEIDLYPRVRLPVDPHTCGEPPQRISAEGSKLRVKESRTQLTEVLALI